uniref:F-box/kelch-repeat protein At5g42360 family n=1 Tax=Cajanus cajan TaxID=3821 RepID=A0A151TCT6_CAJCA|nr:F-box/kelch-repeat protein At5g42360 family [Cajanus cajan]
MFSERLGADQSHCQDLQSLSVSKRLVRSVSQKLRKKNIRNVGEEDDDDVNGVSLRCLNLYGRGGGCKVGADTSDDFGDSSSRRRSNGFCSGEIHVLDVSMNQWHRIDADFLRGRFLFSVAGILDDIFVVGGCSSLTNFGKVDRSSFKTHKGVLVFSPLTKSWRKMPSMKYARSNPILGVSEVSLDFPACQSHQSRQDRRFPRSRIGGVSDVYEDPHKLSMRPVGGLGSWDEPLDSGEIYDSVSNKWTEIPRLPFDFGVARSGTVCGRMFYVFSETDTLAAYDIERGFWVAIQTTPIPPRVHEYYPKLVSSNGRLFLLSVSWCEGDGQIGRRNKAVRKLWELDLMYLTWTEASVHPDAPMDWNAVFVADNNLVFGVEMFKIFGRVLGFFTVCDVSDMANWNHISRNHATHELDGSSCLTKSVAVLHL